MSQLPNDFEPVGPQFAPTEDMSDYVPVGDTSPPGYEPVKPPAAPRKTPEQLRDQIIESNRPMMPQAQPQPIEPPEPVKPLKLDPDDIVGVGTGRADEISRLTEQYLQPHKQKLEKILGMGQGLAAKQGKQIDTDAQIPEGIRAEQRENAIITERAFFIKRKAIEEAKAAGLRGHKMIKFVRERLEKWGLPPLMQLPEEMPTPEAPEAKGTFLEEFGKWNMEMADVIGEAAIGTGKFFGEAAKGMTYIHKPEFWQSMGHSGTDIWGQALEYPKSWVREAPAIAEDTLAAAAGFGASAHELAGAGDTSVSQTLRGLQKIWSTASKLHRQGVFDASELTKAFNTLQIDPEAKGWMSPHEKVNDPTQVAYYMSKLGQGGVSIAFAYVPAGAAGEFVAATKLLKTKQAVMGFKQLFASGMVGIMEGSQVYNDFYEEIMEETNDPDKANWGALRGSTAVGIANGLLEKLGPSRVFFAKNKKAMRSLWGSVMRFIDGAATEGGTEAGQELMTMLAEAAEEIGEPFDREGAKRILESFVAGIMIGGPIAGATSGTITKGAKDAQGIEIEGEGRPSKPVRTRPSAEARIRERGPEEGERGTEVQQPQEPQVAEEGVLSTVDRTGLVRDLETAVASEDMTDETRSAVAVALGVEKESDIPSAYLEADDTQLQTAETAIRESQPDLMPRKEAPDARQTYDQTDKETTKRTPKPEPTAEAEARKAPEAPKPVPVKPSRRQQALKEVKTLSGIQKAINKMNPRSPVRLARKTTLGTNEKDIASIAKALGLDTKFYTVGGKGEAHAPPGFADPDIPNRIWVQSQDSRGMMRQVAAHEASHGIEATNKEEWLGVLAALGRVAPTYLNAAGKSYLADMISNSEKGAEEAAKLAKDPHRYAQEAVARVFEDLATKDSFWEDLKNYDKTVWRRMLDWFNEAMERISGTFTEEQAAYRTVVKALQERMKAIESGDVTKDRAKSVPKKGKESTLRRKLKKAKAGPAVRQVVPGAYKGSARTEYSDAAVKKRLVGFASEIPGALVSEDDTIIDAILSGFTKPTQFDGPLPAEITDHFQTRKGKAALRMLLKRGDVSQNVPGGMAEDVIGELTERFGDGYQIFVNLLERYIAGDKADTIAAVKFFTEQPESHVEGSFLAYYHGQRDALGKGFKPNQALVDPMQLPMSATFTINEEPFSIAELDEGIVIESEDRSFPVIGFDSIPVDEGSLKTGKTKKTAQQVLDAMLEAEAVPFAQRRRKLSPGVMRDLISTNVEGLSREQLQQHLANMQQFIDAVESETLPDNFYSVVMSPYAKGRVPKDMWMFQNIRTGIQETKDALNALAPEPRGQAGLFGEKTAGALTGKKTGKLFETEDIEMTSPLIEETKRKDAAKPEAIEGQQPLFAQAQADRFKKLLAAADKRESEAKTIIRRAMDPDSGGAIGLPDLDTKYGGIVKRYRLISKNTGPNREEHPWRVTSYDTHVNNKISPSGHVFAKTLEKAIHEVWLDVHRPQDIDPDVKFAMRNDWPVKVRGGMTMRVGQNVPPSMIRQVWENQKRSKISEHHLSVRALLLPDGTLLTWDALEGLHDDVMDGVRRWLPDIQDAATLVLLPHGVDVSITGDIPHAQAVKRAQNSGRLRTLYQGEVPLSGDAAFLSEMRGPLYAQARQTANRSKIGFYHKSLQVVSGLQGKGTGEQYLAQLKKKGVKPEEIAWLGLDDFLEGKGKVSREEIEAFIKDNAVGVTEVVKSGDARPDRWNLAEDVELETRARRQTDEGIEIEYFEPFTRDFWFATIEKTGPTWFWSTEDGGGESESQGSASREAYENIQESIFKEAKAEAGDIRYGGSDLNLPGGKQYRELLLTLPEGTRGTGEFYVVWEESGISDVSFQSEEEAQAYYDQMSKAGMGKGKIDQIHEETPVYRGAHWEESNILVHTRFNERIGPEGQKILFIEEIQSDWHQAGRDQGYDTAEVTKANEGRLKELKQAYIKSQEETDKYGRDVFDPAQQRIASELNRLSEAQGVLVAGMGTTRERAAIKKRRYGLNRINKIVDEAGEISQMTKDAFITEVVAGDLISGEDARKALSLIDEYRAAHAPFVEHYQATDLKKREWENIKNARLIPDAPFKKTWHELAFKRMVTWAAENGFDQIAWTTGEQQAARYDLSKAVDAIAFSSHENNVFVMFEGLKGFSDQTLEVQVKKDTGLINTVDVGAPEQWVGKHLSDIVGKNHADKILGEGEGKIEGPDLTIGGEMHKLLYDKKLVQAASKLGKKMGVKVGKTEIVVKPPILSRTDYVIRFASTESVHSLEITDQMREVVKQEGLPLFAQKANAKLPLSENGTLPAETTWDLMIRKVQDSFKRIKEVEKWTIESGGKVEEAASTYLAHDLFSGQVAAKVEAFKKNRVDRLVTVINRLELKLDDVGRYLIAKHAPDRNPVIASRNKDMPDGGAGMLTAEAEEALAEFNKQGLTPKLERVARIVYQIASDTRALLVESGLATQEEVDGWVELFGEYYVPLRKDMEAKGLPATRIGRGFKIMGREFKHALGRSTMPDNPLAFVILDHYQTIVRAEKNKVARALWNFVEANPNDELWLPDQPATTRYLKPGKKENAVETAQHRIWADDKGNTWVEDKNTGVVAIGPDPRYKLNDNVVVLKIDGQQHTIEFLNNAEAMAWAMNNVGSGGTMKLLKFTGKVNRILSELSTSWNPGFTIPNFLRDIQTAVFNVTVDHSVLLAARIVKGVPAALWGSWQGIRNHKKKTKAGKAFMELTELGGRVGWFHLPDFSNQMRDIVGRLKDVNPSNPRRIGMALRSVKDFIENMNLAVEHAVRLSAFIELKKDIESGKLDWTVKKAAAYVKSMTVNFNRKGEWGHNINALYLFGNASIQGTARFLEATATRKGIIIGTSLMSMALGLDMLNRMLSDDDDDGEKFYDKIPDWVKERNMIIMLPGTYWDEDKGRKTQHHLIIPLPYGYSVFHSIGQQAAATLPKDMWGAGQSPLKGAANVTTAAIGSFNPLGGESGVVQTLMPTLADPIVQIETNKTFYGAPIAPEKDQFGPAKPASEMYYRSVSEHSKLATKWLNEMTGGDVVTPGGISVSPEYVDHLIEFATGGLGRTIGRSIVGIEKAWKGDVPEFKDIPVWRRFAGAPDPYHHVRKYRENMNELAWLTHALEHYEQTGEEGKTAKLREEFAGILEHEQDFDEYRKAISQFNSQIYAIKDQEEIDRLNKDKDALMREANKTYLRAKEGKETEQTLIEGLGERMTDDKIQQTIDWALSDEPLTWDIKSSKYPLAPRPPQPRFTFRGNKYGISSGARRKFSRLVGTKLKEMVAQRREIFDDAERTPEQKKKVFDALRDAARQIALKELFWSRMEEAQKAQEIYPE